MITLRSISFEGIGRFVSPQKIFFDNEANIVGVVGKNLNTGGSSGGAKSTIFRAIDYLFGVSDIPAKSILSRYSDSMKVEAELDVDGKTHVISRGTKSGLSIEWEGGSVSGNSALAEEKLDELIKIPRELFRLSYHKRQGEGGFFLNLTPKQTFEFLTSALSLDRWQKEIDTVQKELSGISSQKMETEVRLKISEELFVKAQKEHEEAKESYFLAESLQEPDKAQVDRLEIDLESLREESAKIKTPQPPVLPKKAAFVPDMGLFKEIAAMEDALKGAESKVKEENTVRLQKLQIVKSALKKAEQDLNQAKTAERDLLRVEKALVGEKNNLAHLKSGTCPTCSQGWVTDDSKVAIASLEASISQKELEVSSLKSSMKTIPELSEKVSKLSLGAEKLSETILADTSDIEKEIRRLNDIAVEQKANFDAEYQAEILLANGQYQKEVEIVDKKNREIRLQIDEKTRALNELLSVSTKKIMAMTRAKEDRDRTSKALDHATSTRTGLVKTLESLEKQSLLLEESKLFLKSYIMTAFDEALDSIGNKATETLKNLPNMNTASIYFDSFKELTSGSKKGQVKEEVTAILSVDGEQGISVKTLSGGERASVDLAVDLAVMDVIEERSGLGLNILILDEPCTGMDSRGKESYIDVLKLSGTKKKILIVDHSSEIQEMVDDEIQVLREGLYSRIMN